MKYPLYQVDAFADAMFAGNPAAIIPLESWLPDAMMQAVAAENNLSETAFFCAEEIGVQGRYALRWFTPTAEVDLCGHATLASAWVVLHVLEPGLPQVVFSTRSGLLTVRKAGEDLLEMDFPALDAEPLGGEESVRIADSLGRVLGVRPVELHRGANLLAVFSDEAAIRALHYDSELAGALAQAHAWGLIATAPADAGTGIDFISRFFAPAKGVPEDPVTGSAHCLMAPYWAARLGRTELVARQVSARGGMVYCRHRGARVNISGRCAPYLEGVITLPA